MAAKYWLNVDGSFWSPNIQIVPKYSKKAEKIEGSNEWKLMEPSTGISFPTWIRQKNRTELKILFFECGNIPIRIC
jgi:hypothetical protein